MTVPSTEELQRLLDAATPGEWHLHEDETGDPEGTYLHDTKGVMCIAITPIGSGSDYRKGDLDLAALAPVLAAEVIRLRVDIECMREELSELGDENLMIAPPDKRVAYREAARACTRILEGDQA